MCPEDITTFRFIIEQSVARGIILPELNNVDLPELTNEN